MPDHAGPALARRRLPLLLLALLVATAALLLPPAAAERSALPAATGDDLATTAARAGASGIGDRYFPADGSGGIDVRTYDVHVRYDFARGLLAGRTRIVLRTTQALRSFGLDLLLPVRSVRVDGRRAGFSKPTRHELRVRPARPLAQGRRVVVVVDYAGRPGELSYLGERNWLADRREVVTMNQPHMAPWWFPANDHPSDKARFDIRVSVPRGREVVSNGELVRRTVRDGVATSHWRSREPMATYLAFFAAGDFVVERGRTDGLPWVNAVSAQLPPRVRAGQQRFLRRTPGVVRWLERELGAYPFRSTGGVVTALPVYFALENQTRPTYYAGSPDDVSLVVHEQAHQWFGDSVALERWRDIWLNEGLATWLEVRYAETHGGPPGSQWLRDQYASRPAGDPFWRLRIGDPGAARIFDEAVYVRGAMTAQALRERIGAAEFGLLLRRWAATHRHGNATGAQFRVMAEQVSGQDLDGFFEAWLDTASRPAPTAANGLG